MKLVTNEFLKNLPSNWLMYIYVIFNKIRKEGKIPDSWTKIIVKMLYKKVVKIYLKTLEQSRWYIQF